MTYRGTLKQAVVVLEPGAALAEGEQVEVRPLVESAEGWATLYDRYKRFIGVAEGLPEDFADEHDHYIHGTPKRTGK